MLGLFFFFLENVSSATVEIAQGYLPSELEKEAILRGVKEMLKKKLPDANLTALSIDPEYMQTQTGVNAERIESPKSLLKNRDRYLKLFREADAHLLTGGTPFKIMGTSQG